MPKYIVHVFMLFLICFCTDMVGEEDEQQRRNREARMRKGKEVTAASAQRERVEQNPYVPKTRKRKDPRLVGDISQSHIDYSSQVVDPTQVHEYTGYAGGFKGYDRMGEEAMFYQPQEEAEDEEVAEEEDAEADDIVPEPKPRRRRRAPLMPPYPVVGPPFPGGPETIHLLSDYARHVAIPLWVNHHNVRV